MGKQDKGFFDGLMEDFAATLDMKAAIEITRDKNGKVDAAKATGIAMGLGHTSDNDIALMAGMLGADGAFDYYNDDEIEYDSYDGTWSTAPPIPAPVSSAFISTQPHILTQAEYNQRKQEILKACKTNQIVCGIAIGWVTFFVLYQASKLDDAAGVFWLITAVIDALLAFTIYYACKTRNRKLSELETEYRDSQKREQELQNEKESEQAYEDLKNYARTSVPELAADRIKHKMKEMFDRADEASGTIEPTFSYEMFAAFLSALFYFTIKSCDETAAKKARFYDRMVSQTAIKTDYTSNLLFAEDSDELDSVLYKLMKETFVMLIISAYKFGDGSEAEMDFTKTVCSLMILLGEDIERVFGFSGLKKEGASLVLVTSKKATDRVIDERLLG